MNEKWLHNDNKFENILYNLSNMERIVKHDHGINSQYTIELYPINCKSNEVYVLKFNKVIDRDNKFNEILSILQINE